jgi:hypothetical protein
MIKNWISIVPRKPDFVPSLKDRQTVLKVLSEYLPEAMEHIFRQSEGIRFIHSHDVPSAAKCPRCSAELPRKWWRQAMADDFVSVTYDRQRLRSLIDGVEPQAPRATQFDFGFLLADYDLPCCGARASLDTLVYEPATAFGVFLFSIENPNGRRLSAPQFAALEIAMGCPVTPVYYRA